jgi:hypothetical protein
LQRRSRGPRDYRFSNWSRISPVGLVSVNWAQTALTTQRAGPPIARRRTRNIGRELEVHLNSPLIVRLLGEQDTAQFPSKRRFGGATTRIAKACGWRTWTIGTRAIPAGPLEVDARAMTCQAPPACAADATASASRATPTAAFLATCRILIAPRRLTRRFSGRICRPTSALPSLTRRAALAQVLTGGSALTFGEQRPSCLMPSSPAQDT